MSLNRLFLSFSASCDFLKKILFFEKKIFKKCFFEKKFLMIDRSVGDFEFETKFKKSKMIVEDKYRSNW